MPIDILVSEFRVEFPPLAFPQNTRLALLCDYARSSRSSWIILYHSFCTRDDLEERLTTSSYHLNSTQNASTILVLQECTWSTIYPYPSWKTCLSVLSKTDFISVPISIGIAAVFTTPFPTSTSSQPNHSRQHQRENPFTMIGS